MKKLISKSIIYLAFLVGSAAVYSGNVCVDNKKCTSDEFSMQSTWVSYEFLDQFGNSTIFLNDSERKFRMNLLQHCFFMITLGLNKQIFVESNKNRKVEISSTDYAKKTAKIGSNATLLRDTFPKKCANGDLSYVEYLELVERILVKGRPPTNLDAIRSSPEDFSGQTIRVANKGRYTSIGFSISNGVADRNSVVVDLGKIRSEVREKLEKACGQAGEPCDVDMLGIVVDESSGIKIVATEFWAY